MEKRRSAGIVSGELLVGDVEGSLAIVVDDLIPSGGTMVRAANKLRKNGASSVICCAAHGLFTGGAEQLLTSSAIERLVISDFLPPFRVSGAFVETRCEIVSAAPLFASCIRALEGDGSISALLGEDS